MSIPASHYDNEVLAIVVTSCRDHGRVPLSCVFPVIYLGGLLLSRVYPEKNTGTRSTIRHSGRNSR